MVLLLSRDNVKKTNIGHSETDYSDKLASLLLKECVLLISNCISFFFLFFSPGDGYMTFSDFIKTMEEYKKPDDKVDLMMAFKVFDCNNKGYIETKELGRASMRLKGITREELEELLATANLEKDRNIYFEGTMCRLSFCLFKRKVR